MHNFTFICRIILKNFFSLQCTYILVTTFDIMDTVSDQITCNFFSLNVTYNFYHASITWGCFLLLYYNRVQGVPKGEILIELKIIMKDRFTLSTTVFSENVTPVGALPSFILPSVHTGNRAIISIAGLQT